MTSMSVRSSCVFVGAVFFCVSSLAASPPPVTSTRAMAATAHPKATEAALTILKQGGNECAVRTPGEVQALSGKRYTAQFAAAVSRSFGRSVPGSGRLALAGWCGRGLDSRPDDLDRRLAVRLLRSGPTSLSDRTPAADVHGARDFGTGSAPGHDRVRIRRHGRVPRRHLKTRPQHWQSHRPSSRQQTPNPAVVRFVIHEPVTA